jgi:hypothetical protein
MSTVGDTGYAMQPAGISRRAVSGVAAQRAVSLEPVEQPRCSPLLTVPTASVTNVGQERFVVIVSRRAPTVELQV